jgi:hypothetical protein
MAQPALLPNAEAIVVGRLLESGQDAPGTFESLFLEEVRPCLCILNTDINETHQQQGWNRGKS